MRAMVRKFGLNSVVVLSLIAFAIPAPARAASNTQTIAVASGVGILGGTLVGLATVPLTQNINSMFYGSAVGLFLGLAAGIIYVVDRESQRPPPPPPPESQEGLFPEHTVSLSSLKPAPAWVQVSYPVLRF